MKAATLMNAFGWIFFPKENCDVIKLCRNSIETKSQDMDSTFEPVGLSSLYFLELFKMSTKTQVSK